jgi:hypothetical protein
MNARVSVVVPVSNQEDHIHHVLETYLRELSALPCDVELIPVVNASSDSSADHCRRLARRHPGVQVVEIEDGGWGRAVRTGLGVSAGSLIAYTNSARTTASDLVRVVNRALHEPDCVVKARRVARDRLNRRVGSLLYNLECRALLGTQTWDVNGTPKVFPRAFEPLMNLTTNDDLIDAEFMARCRRCGYPFVEVPLRATRRHGGRSTTRYGSAMVMYRGVFRLRRELSRVPERSGLSG